MPQQPYGRTAYIPVAKVSPGPAPRGLDRPCALAGAVLTNRSRGAENDEPRCYSPSLWMTLATCAASIQLILSFLRIGKIYVSARSSCAPAIGVAAVRRLGVIPQQRAESADRSHTERRRAEHAERPPRRIGHAVTGPVCDIGLHRLETIARQLVTYTCSTKRRQMCPRTSSRRRSGSPCTTACPMLRKCMLPLSGGCNLARGRMSDEWLPPLGPSMSNIPGQS